MIAAEDIEDLGLSEADWQAIDEGQRGTPPNAAEWACYFRQRDEERHGNQRARNLGRNAAR